MTSRSVRGGPRPQPRLGQPLPQRAAMGGDQRLGRCLAGQRLASSSWPERLSAVRPDRTPPRSRPAAPGRRPDRPRAARCRCAGAARRSARPAARYPRPGPAGRPRSPHAPGRGAAGAAPPSASGSAQRTSRQAPAGEPAPDRPAPARGRDRPAAGRAADARPVRPTGRSRPWLGPGSASSRSRRGTRVGAAAQPASGQHKGQAQAQAGEHPAARSRHGSSWGRLVSSERGCCSSVSDSARSERRHGRSSSVCSSFCCSARWGRRPRPSRAGCGGAGQLVGTAAQAAHQRRIGLQQRLGARGGRRADPRRSRRHRPSSAGCRPAPGQRHRAADRCAGPAARPAGSGWRRSARPWASVDSMRGEPTV